MGRTDVRALELPEMNVMLPAAMEAQAAPEPAVITVAQVVHADAAKPAPVQRDACPNCNSRLSDIEIKFDRCMGCGKSFSALDGSKINVGL